MIRLITNLELRWQVYDLIKEKDKIEKEAQKLALKAHRLETELTLLKFDNRKGEI